MGVEVDFVAHDLSCHLKLLTKWMVKITSKVTTLDKIVPTTDVHLLINSNKGSEVPPIGSILLRTRDRDLMDPINKEGSDRRGLHLKVDVVVVMQMVHEDHDRTNPPTKALKKGLVPEIGIVFNVEH